MSTRVVLEIVRQAETLPLEEQLYLITLLAEKAQQVYRPTAPRRRWREICGAAPYPLMGEDAQAWVSRARQEDDEARERRQSGRP
jgi:hypothetical protein